MKITALFLTLLSNAAAWAGTIGITASGTASLPAEYLSLVATVHSKCYPKSKEAAAANAKLSNEILEILNRYVTDETRQRLRDPITAVGGHFVRQTELAFRDNQRVVLCENGWRTAKQLSLKLVRVDQIPEVQDAILEVVDRRPEVRFSGEPQTWAELASPSPQLTEASERSLMEKALRNAIENARHELKAIVSECRLLNVKLSSIRSPVGSRHSEPEVARMAAVSDSTTSPFLFGQLSATVTRLFVFDYETAACSE